MNSGEALHQALVEAGAVSSEVGGRMQVAHFGDAQAEYLSLTQQAGLVPLLDRTQVEMTGADRQIMLGGFCTNDVKSLTPGEGCEAFITSGQGKTLGYVNVFCGSDSLVLETAAKQAETLIAHLDRYVIREDVQFIDRSTDWVELLLAGPNSAAVLQAAQSQELPGGRLAHVDSQIAGCEVSIRLVDWTGATGYLLSGPRARMSQVWRALLDAGARPCGYAALETARIEAGTPMFGQDVTEANLPQELDRDSLAVSFTKGCYLGQETVARIDALGHVNQVLRAVEMDGGQPPQPGEELQAEGKKVGRVTSSAMSPKLGKPLALAFVKRGRHTPGSQVTIGPHTGKVLQLPLGGS